MKFACIDIETTGLIAGLDTILEIGIVIDDLDAPPNPDPPIFHAYIKHDRITGQPYALALNAEIIKIIVEDKHQDLMCLDLAANKIQMFLRTHFKNGKVTAAGKNFQGFDKPFLDKAFGSIFNFHHRCFDATTNFYQKGDKELPDLKLCLERAKIDLPFKLHTAVDDAKAVIALLRHIHKDCSLVKPSGVTTSHSTEGIIEDKGIIDNEMTAIRAMIFCLLHITRDFNGGAYSRPCYDVNGCQHWIYWSSKNGIPTLRSESPMPFVQGLEPYTNKRKQ